LGGAEDVSLLENPEKLQRALTRATPKHFFKETLTHNSRPQKIVFQKAKNARLIL